MKLDRYPQNPDYGGGALRRRIRFAADDHTVAAQLDDNHHAMQVRLHHDGEGVSAIRGEIIRAPMSTSPGAVAVLQELVGEPLLATPGELSAGGRARRNCTHLFDLALLAVSFATARAARRQIDIVVPDAIAGRRTVSVDVNGAPFLEWALQDDVIVGPEPWCGQPLFVGFVRRVLATNAGLERDAALMAQKTVIVARGRSHVFDRRQGAPAAEAGGLLGACYSYSASQYGRARELPGHALDFSNRVVEAPVVLGL